MNTSLDQFIEKINTSPHCFFDDPRNFDFNQKMIDIKLRKLLSKINKSKWCWTLFSCQGHSYKDKSYSLPYFVFVVKNEYKATLVDLLMKTIDNDVLSLKFPVHNPHSLEISLGYYDQDFSIVSAHWSISHLKKRGKLKELHQKFEVLADNILEINCG